MCDRVGIMSDTFVYVKIEVFIPNEYVNALRDGLGEIGVGRIGNYDHCISISDVRGYWRPLAGAVPYAGEIGEISSGQECKVEVNCKQKDVNEALRVMRDIHPYDKPLINVIPLLNHEFEGLEL